MTNGSPNRKASPVYANHSWKGKEVRRIVPRTAKEKGLSIKFVIGFWYITQDSRPGRVTPYFGPFLVTDVAEGSVWIKTHPKYGGLAVAGYPQLKRYDVLDDRYDSEEDLQESLEAAAKDLAADPMDSDEELPPIEEDSSLRMPERDISPSRPTVPRPTAIEATPKRISASCKVFLQPIFSLFSVQNPHICTLTEFHDPSTVLDSVGISESGISVVLH